MTKVIPISTPRKNYQEVRITVSRHDIKAGLPHPWLSPVACALTSTLNIDGAEVGHEQIHLFRAGKKDVVIPTPESVQRFEYLFDMHGKGLPFGFSVVVPQGLVMKEVA